MSVPEALSALSERLAGSANIKSVFGEPVTVGERVIIPVARIAYGLGGGSGKHGEKSQEGAGMGGGAAAIPAGVWEISAAGTRFIPANANRKLAVAVLVGFCAGLWFGRR